MKRYAVWVALAAGLPFMLPGDAGAWGRGGGGFRAGGFGGYRGGFAAGGYRGFDGYRGGFEGYRGYEGYRGGYDAYRGGYGRIANDYGLRGYDSYRGGYAAVGNRYGYAGDRALASDFGFGHVAAGGRYVAAGHYTHYYSGGVVAARGTTVRSGYYRYGYGCFNPGWWGAHPNAWHPWGWRGWYAWGWPTWPVLTGWFGWSAPPVYYDFGNTIVYTGDEVYVNGQPDCTAAQYYQQAADLAESAPTAPPTENKDEQWQPLGVFAMVQGEQSDPAAVIQLAVNKQGTIRGNYFDVLSNANSPVRGAVDKKTQRASWVVGDNTATVFDTGIYNLTKEQSPLLVHFGKDRTQQWLLVRVRQQDAEGSSAAGTAAEAAPAAPSGAATEAVVTVIVPTADAEVFFDGAPTTETGTTRTFNTPPLDGGQTYTYTIRARWNQGGQLVDQSRTVSFAAGSHVTVNFNNPAP